MEAASRRAERESQRRYRQLQRQAKEQAKQQTLQQAAYQNYCQRHTDWSERCELAGKILQGDTQAYTEALIGYNPFVDISELGASMEFKPHNPQLVEVRLTADGERLIPNQIKSLTSTGKLSTKEMPQGQFYQIYLNFVCGVALRAGRELFAFLPVQVVLVNIQASLLNTRTGHQGLGTILSVAMSRTVFGQLNFNRLDPSDAMENFPHRMEFKKTTGFAPVAPFDYTEASEVRPDGRGVGRGVDAPPTSELPSTSDVRKLLATKPLEDGCFWISAGEAAGLIGFSQEQRLGLPLCRRIAEVIQDSGFCIEPDARFGGGVYEWEQGVAVFRPVDPTAIPPTPAYQGAANLLRLCVLVAAADGTIDKEELAVFRQIIETQLNFSSTELKRLSALERLLAKNAETGAKTLAKVAKGIPAEKRMLVAQVLVKVAAVDHVITKSEFGVLQRVFKAFELPSEKLSELILQVCPFPEEATVQEATPGPAGEAIPRPSSAQEFSLDMSKVYAITNETKEVVGILSVVMQDEKQEVAPASPMPLARPSAITAPVSPSPADGKLPPLNKFTGLDPVFQPILERLLAKDAWPRTEFHALAGEFQLMPLSIQDVINEWADEALGDFLLEGEDPVLIRRDLIQKEKT